MADDPPAGRRSRRLALGYAVVATGLALAWAVSYDPWWIQPANRVFGTMSVSTTRIHGLKSIDEKYSAATRASSSVAAIHRRL